MTSPLIKSRQQSNLAETQLKRLSNLNLARLSLFQGCLGCLAVIFAGMLNRIMISELAFPAILVGGGLAFEQLMAPSRVLFGRSIVESLIFWRASCFIYVLRSSLASAVGAEAPERQGLRNVGREVYAKTQLNTFNSTKTTLRYQNTIRYSHTSRNGV